MTDRILVEHLSTEQREKLAHAAALMGRDEQDVLDSLPEICDSIIEAFEPVRQSIIAAKVILAEQEAAFEEIEFRISQLPRA